MTWLVDWYVFWFLPTGATIELQFALHSSWKPFPQPLCLQKSIVTRNADRIKSNFSHHYHMKLALSFVSYLLHPCSCCVAHAVRREALIIKKKETVQRLLHLSKKPFSSRCNSWVLRCFLISCTFLRNEGYPYHFWINRRMRNDRLS